MDPSQGEPATLQSFGDHFYGVNGFRVLISRAEAGRETLRQMAQYLSGRASLEESYARGMVALNNGALNRGNPVTPEDKEKADKAKDAIEFGSFLNAFRMIRAEAEYMGRQHHQFQAILSTTMHTQVTELESRQHKAQSKLISNCQKVINEMTGLKKQYRKLHDRYLKAMYLSDSATREQKQNPEPSQTLKLEEKAAAAKKTAESATDDYRDIVTRIGEYQSVYDETLTTTLQEFQQMEEERILAIKHIVGQYKDFHQILQVGMNDSCGRIGMAVDLIDDAADLTKFMQRRGTGNERGVPIEFEEYTEQAYLATLSKSGLRAATVLQPTEAQRPSEKAGFLRKRGHLVRNWKQRYFKLIGAALYYYEDDQSPDPIQGIPLVGASVEVADDKVKKGEMSTCFVIDTHSKKYFVKADNPSEMQEWISAIHQAQGRREGWQRGTDRVRKLDPSKAGGASSSMPTVIAVHQFPGQAENGELAFEEGEIITVVSVEDPGWWEGEIGPERSGIFPSNYVKIYTGDKQAATPAAAAPAAPAFSQEAPVEAEAEPAPIDDYEPEVYPPTDYPAEVKADPELEPAAGEVSVPEPIMEAEVQPQAVVEPVVVGGGGLMYRAVWDFPGTDEGELGFSSGDIVEVTNQDDEGWWYGTINGVVGMFPSNYVEAV